MTNKTRNWLLSILNSEKGDIERAARWMARNFRTVGNVKFFRDQLNEAAK